MTAMLSKLKIEHEELRKSFDAVLCENKCLRSLPGPIVYVGDIIVKLHKLGIETDMVQNQRPHLDNYYWFKKWFAPFTDNIVYQSNHTK
jgi:hypothetical protein